MIIFQILPLLLGLVLTYYLLAKVCDTYFVTSLEKISRRFDIPDDVNGATFMAVGTSAPEFFTAIIAITRIGTENIGIGTIVGSAIFNLLVIIGAVAIIKPLTLKWEPIMRDIVFYLIGIIILLVTFSDGIITAYEALLFVFTYILYILILTYWKTMYPKAGDIKEDFPAMTEAIKSEEKEMHKRNTWFSDSLEFIDKALKKSFPNLNRYPRLFMFTFVLSIFYIVLLSWSLVELAVGLATTLQIPQVIIALTILAGGTSVPDLLSSLAVARKNKGDMAVSNAIASNTFDIMIGIGLPWLAYTLITQNNLIVSTEKLYGSILILLFVTFGLLGMFLIRKFRIGKTIGFTMLGLYAAFLIFKSLQIF